MLKNINLKYLLLLLFILLSCPEPPKDNTSQRDTTIHLKVINTFTTTAKLYISVDDTTAAWDFGLKRNGEDILTATVFNNDTTFVDNALTPSTQYTYQAQWMEDGIAVDSSEGITTQTMDTTSHNFVWEIDTLGEYGSYLNDVAIIDENNIWVVGMIKIPDPDSSFNGTGWESFNAAHWDGTEWELLGIYSNTLDLYSIQYFSEDDIWVLSSYPIHWDGNEWIHYHLTDMGIIPGGLRGEIWGASSDDIYFVGAQGRIVHYDGSTFTEMESGTEINLEDISATEDGEHVFVSGWKWSVNPNSPLLHINSNNVELIYLSTYPWGNEEDWGRIEAIEVIGDTVYMATWGRDWIAYNYLTDEYVEYGEYTLPGFDNLQIRDISSNGVNDISAIGGYGEVVHNNGLTWQRDNGIYSVLGENFIMNRADIKDDLIIVVGEIWGNAGGVIARGYRNQ